MITNKGRYREARYRTKQKQKRMKVLQSRDNNYDEVDLLYCAKMNIIYDGKFTSCCQEGKVKLTVPAEAAENLLFIFEYVSSRTN